MLTYNEVMNYSKRIKNPSSARIAKVNEIIEKRYNTKNFNNLSPTQIEWGSRLLNIPLKELNIMYKHYIENE
jgi:rRNA maturation endonuclease Nob1